jgi:hypothetical protein
MRDVKCQYCPTFMTSLFLLSSEGVGSSKQDAEMCAAALVPALDPRKIRKRDLARHRPGQHDGPPDGSSVQRCTAVLNIL